jgi:hypothetical protein
LGFRGLVLRQPLLQTTPAAPRGPRCSQELPRAVSVPEAPRGHKRLPDAPRCSQRVLERVHRGSRKLPEAAGGSQKLPAAPRGSKRLPEASNGSLQLPQACRRFPEFDPQRRRGARPTPSHSPSRPCVHIVFEMLASTRAIAEPHAKLKPFTVCDVLASTWRTANQTRDSAYPYGLLKPGTTRA